MKSPAGLGTSVVRQLRARVSSALRTMHRVPAMSPGCSAHRLSAAAGGQQVTTAGPDSSNKTMVSSMAAPVRPSESVLSGLCTRRSCCGSLNIATWRGVEELRSAAVGAAVVPRAVPSVVQKAAAALAEAPTFDQDAPELELSAKDDADDKFDKITNWLEVLLPGMLNDQISGVLAEDILWCCSVYESAHAVIPSSEEEPGGSTAPQARRVKLELVDRPGCTRFHMDYLQARLLRVYFGPTTEVLDGAGVNWEAFDAFRGNEHIVSDPGKVFQMPTGSVMVLKGRHFHRGVKRTGCIHRSPNLDAPGWLYNSRGQPRRLLLTVDDIHR